MLKNWPAGVDPFASPLNNRLPVYYLPIQYPQAIVVDSMLLMEPPSSLCRASFALSRPVINRIRQTIAAGFTLIASFWPQKSRSSQTTLFSSFSSRSPRSLNLHAWRLSNHPPCRKASGEVARFISRARHPNTMKL